MLSIKVETKQTKRLVTPNGTGHFGEVIKMRNVRSSAEEMIRFIYLFGLISHRIFLWTNKTVFGKQACVAADPAPYLWTSSYLGMRRTRNTIPNTAECTKKSARSHILAHATAAMAIIPLSDTVFSYRSLFLSHIPMFAPAQPQSVNLFINLHGCRGYFWWKKAQKFRPTPIETVWDRLRNCLRMDANREREKQKKSKLKICTNINGSCGECECVSGRAVIVCVCIWFIPFPWVSISIDCFRNPMTRTGPTPMLKWNVAYIGCATAIVEMYKKKPIDVWGQIIVF